jgi:hypothetical protein
MFRYLSMFYLIPYLYFVFSTSINKITDPIKVEEADDKPFYILWLSTIKLQNFIFMFMVKKCEQIYDKYETQKIKDTHMEINTIIDSFVMEKIKVPLRDIIGPMSTTSDQQLNFNLETFLLDISSLKDKIGEELNDDDLQKVTECVENVIKNY